MKHLDYVELLTNPLASGEGGGGVTPSGSVTLTKNTDSNGVDVTNKAKAVVDVQGGAAYDYVWPYIPDGYTELIPTNGITRNVVVGYKAGQTNKQVSARLPLSITLTNGDKVAIHGTTSDTSEEFVVAGTVSGKTSYSTYQYAKLNIDYDGMVGIATALAIKANGSNIDVRGRDTVNVSVSGSGTIQITQNGTVTVDGYRYAEVNVQAPPSGGSDVVDFTGVKNIGENGICADSRDPNTTITKMRFPNLETLNSGNFTFFTALTDVYFGPSFASIKGMSFDVCADLASVYFDAWAGTLPYITSGYAPGQSTQCIYYMPASLISQAQWDSNWSSLYQMNRIVDLDQAPYSPVVLYRPGQKCIYQGYQWENGSSGQPGVPGVDPAWMQIGPV